MTHPIVNRTLQIVRTPLFKQRREPSVQRQAFTGLDMIEAEMYRLHYECDCCGSSWSLYEAGSIDDLSEEKRECYWCETPVNPSQITPL